MSKASKSQDSVQTSFLVYVYNNERVAGPRRDNFEDSINACRTLFPAISPNHQISLHTRDLDICEGQLTKLSPGIWADIIPHLKSVVLTAQRVPQAPAPVQETSDTFALQFSSMINPDDSWIVPADRAVRLDAICRRAMDRFGLCSEEYRFVYEGKQISGLEFPDHLSMKDGDVIEFVRTQTGGKPVIYIFSPTPIEASVKLSLVPQWELSAIYPIVQGPKPPATQREVEWRVRTHENGDLSELNTGLDISYLFWEAHTLPKTLDSPPPSPVLQGGSNTLTETFVPNDAVITNENAVLLSVDAITPYLDAALRVLGLHTEARTSFITYWLPSLLKHKRVALRFLPQMAYAKAAPLDITPTPNVMTRIFMLFKGVDEADLTAWSTAEAKAQQSVAFWQDVVDVDIERTLNKQLFRVIEWGGMEVLN